MTTANKIEITSDPVEFQGNPLLFDPRRCGGSMDGNQSESQYNDYCQRISGIITQALTLNGKTYTLLGEIAEAEFGGSSITVSINGDDIFWLSLNVIGNDISPQALRNLLDRFAYAVANAYERGRLEGIKQTQSALRKAIGL